MTALDRSYLRLASAIFAIAIIWLIVLPIVANQPYVADHVARQKESGIDPSAMFYTELSIAPAVADHVERLNERHSARFWRR